MDQFKIILSFIKKIKKNYNKNSYVFQLEINSISEQLISLFRYSSILKTRERVIDIHNIISVAEHIINIRHLIMNYQVFFIDLHNLFEKFLIKINSYQLCQQEIITFPYVSNNELIEKLKTIFSFIQTLDFYLNESYIKKDDILKHVDIINVIDEIVTQTILILQNTDFENITEVKKILTTCSQNFLQCEQLSSELIKFMEKMLSQLNLDECD